MEDFRIRLKRLEAMFNAIPKGIFLWDGNNRMLAANQCLKDIAGRIPPVKIEGDEAKQWPAIVKAVAAMETAGTILGDAGKPLINEDCAKNGYHLSLQPLDTEVEEGKEWLGILEPNPSESPSQESALHTSQRLLRNIIDTVPHPISVKGTDHKYTLVNKAFAEGWDVLPEEIVGKTMEFLEPLREEENRIIRQSDHKVMKEGEVQDVELETEYPFGHKVPFGTTGTIRFVKGPLLDSNGKTQGVVTIVEDITLRVKAREKVNSMERMEAIGGVVGGICHNINNINQIVLGNLILSKEAQGVQFEEFIEKSTEALNRSTALLNQLLAYTKVRLELTGSRIVVATLLESVIHASRDRIPTTLRIEPSGWKEVWPVLADPKSLADALGHLIDNAVQAMPKGGRLDIRSENRTFEAKDPNRPEDLIAGDYVLLQFTDTGKGMSPEVRKQAFEPFFSTENLATRSGLGLTIVYSVVRRFKGTVIIESEEGKGTSVLVYLPKPP